MYGNLNKIVNKFINRGRVRARFTSNLQQNLSYINLNYYPDVEEKPLEPLKLHYFKKQKIEKFKFVDR